MGRFVDVNHLALALKRAADPTAQTPDLDFRSIVLDYSDYGGAREAASGTCATMTSLASPSAQAFMSPLGNDPESQALGLVNHGQQRIRFVVGPDRPWLFHYPCQGTEASGASAPIVLSVSSAGRAPETYRRQLVVRQAPEDGTVAGVADTEYVTFVAVPADSGLLDETC